VDLGINRRTFWQMHSTAVVTHVVATKLGFAVVSELAGFEAASEEPQHQQQQHVL
jgi:hypothetical protein